MVIWITGQSGAGKTTLARQMVKDFNNCILLDGDDLRDIDTDLTFSKEDRYKQGIKTAKLSKLLSDQGFTVIVAVIAPYKDLRKKIKDINGCIFIYLTYNEYVNNKNYPYEPEMEAEIIISRGANERL